MIPLKGHWVFLAGETEFHVVDNVCVAVCCRGGFWNPHAALYARLVGVIGPRRTRNRKVRVGDSLLFARSGEVFYTPPIETIRPPGSTRARRIST